VKNKATKFYIFFSVSVAPRKQPRPKSELDRRVETGPALLSVSTSDLYEVVKAMPDATPVQLADGRHHPPVRLGQKEALRPGASAVSSHAHPRHHEEGVAGAATSWRPRRELGDCCRLTCSCLAAGQQQHASCPTVSVTDC